MLRTVTAGWLLLAAVLARADDPPKTPPSTPAEQLAALQREYDEAIAAYQQAFRDAKTDEERRKAQEKYPRPNQFADRFLALAEKNPKDPAAVDALVWVIEHARGGGPGAGPGVKALAMLQRDHLASPKLAPVCLALTYSYDAASVSFLREVLAKNPHREVQGAACLTLARVLKTHAEVARRVREKPEEAQRLQAFLGKELVADLKARGPDEISAESERLFERVTKEYADLKSGRGTYGTAAETELFELRHLAIGKEAPEITGEDIEGQPLRLSDFRGKVVVLDFWGHW